MSFATQPKYILNILANSKNEKVKEYYHKLEYNHIGDSGIDLYNFNEVPVEFLKVGTIDY